jgi:hypothetical protein
MNIRNEILKEIELRRKKIEKLNYSIECLQTIFDQIDPQPEEEYEEMIKLFLEIIQ